MVQWLRIFKLKKKAKTKKFFFPLFLHFFADANMNYC